jgi:hypothetical protein
MLLVVTFSARLATQWGSKKRGPPLQFLTFAFGKSKNAWKAKMKCLENTFIGNGSPGSISEMHF